ncbi:ArsR/SmtB family transcription factor [Halomarina litorea]|uniref:ArsR/SmtB family transcription factor n=1 Tax=Halomarina litorea TaxID=2961595 RepID=UPI0020C240C9|nr:winged helix-turn-helix domain-containing protein [Halomarina sp. BCD28]
MSLLPLRGESVAEPDEPWVVGLDDENADETFQALSSSTTRRVLAFLYEQPSTPAEIRDEIGTSLQNVHYHLGKLEDADLIEGAGTGYSEKGTEMTVYAPTSEAVVLFAGRESQRSALRSLLARVFGVVLALGLATVALRTYLQGSLGGLTGADGDAGSADTAPTESGDGGGGIGAQDVDGGGAAQATAEATRTASEGAVDAAMALDPALAFFLGGLFVLCVGLGVLYATR